MTGLAKQLRKENAELRRVNEIMMSASRRGSTAIPVLIAFIDNHKQVLGVCV